MIDNENFGEVKFENLVSLGVRQVATTPAPSYIIREFQHIYLYPSSVDINDFKSFDEEEVKEFIEFDIDELINLLLKKCETIKGKTVNEEKKIDLENFVESFLIEDKLYLRLLIASKRFINKEDVELIFW